MKHFHKEKNLFTQQRRLKPPPNPPIRALWARSRLFLQIKWCFIDAQREICLLLLQIKDLYALNKSGVLSSRWFQALLQSHGREFKFCPALMCAVSPNLHSSHMIFVVSYGAIQTIKISFCASLGLLPVCIAEWEARFPRQGLKRGSGSPGNKNTNYNQYVIVRAISVVLQADYNHITAQAL